LITYPEHRTIVGAGVRVDMERRACTGDDRGVDRGQGTGQGGRGSMSGVFDGRFPRRSPRSRERGDLQMAGEGWAGKSRRDQDPIAPDYKSCRHICLPEWSGRRSSDNHMTLLHRDGDARCRQGMCDRWPLGPLMTSRPHSRDSPMPGTHRTTPPRVRSTWVRACGSHQNPGFWTSSPVWPKVRKNRFTMRYLRASEVWVGSCCQRHLSGRPVQKPVNIGVLGPLRRICGGNPHACRGSTCAGRTSAITYDCMRDEGSGQSSCQVFCGQLQCSGGDGAICSNPVTTGILGAL
jgi:hypothetical protein